MAAANYIQDLLYRYECVILPGFGAFITQRQSAQFDENSKQFLPPSKTVIFNRQLIKNDGLLANHIMEVEKISYESAIEKINIFVLELKTVLQENGSIVLGKVGSFTLSKEDKLQFEPAAQTNYLREAFGLSEVLAKDLEGNLEHVATRREQASRRPDTTRWVKYAAIGLIAVGLSGTAGMNIYSNQVNEHNLAEQQKAASQLESQIQKATFVIDNPLPVITLNVERQSGNYHIVAGAFRLEENAAKKVRQLRAAGYKARQIGANKYGLHQVVYSSHEGRLEALQTLRDIKKVHSGAWLLVQDLK